MKILLTFALLVVAGDKQRRDGDEEVVRSEKNLICRNVGFFAALAAKEWIGDWCRANPFARNPNIPARLPVENAGNLGRYRLCVHPDLSDSWCSGTFR